MTSGEGHTDARSVGWLASLSLHAALAFAVLVFTQRITLAPQPAFTWRVAMVTAPSDSPHPSSTTSSPVHALLRRSPSQAPTMHDSPPRAAARSAGTVEAAVSTAYDPTLQENRMPSQPLSGDDMASPHPPAASSVQSPVERPEPPADSLASSQSEQLPSQEARPPAESSTISSTATPSARPDYTWLSETILRRMEELKRYPADARLDRMEGKVVLKAIVKSDGSVDAVEVFRSSGHEVLDRAALELLTLAAPFHFPHSLEKPEMTVKIPMSYKLTP